MIVFSVAHFHGAEVRQNPVGGKRHTVRGVVQQPMAALPGGQHQRECRIAGDLDLFDRVHLHGDSKHASLVISQFFRRARPLRGRGGPVNSGKVDRALTHHEGAPPKIGGSLVPVTASCAPSQSAALLFCGNFCLWWLSSRWAARPITLPARSPRPPGARRAQAARSKLARLSASASELADRLSGLLLIGTGLCCLLILA